MPLFHPRAITKKLRNMGPIPATHATILSAWSQSLSDGVYDRETSNDGEFIQRILVDTLGYSGSSAGPTWTVAKNQPVGTGNVDVALGRFGAGIDPKILAPFELKGARMKDLDAMMSGRNKSPVQQAWEYAMDAKGAQWVIVSNYRQIRLYAVGYGRKDYEAFDLATMTRPENYHRFMLLLSAENLLSGATLDLLKESDATQKEITKQLYAEYKKIRTELIEEIRSSDPAIKSLSAVRMAQTILDRVLFIAFAEDRGLLRKESLKEAFETKNPYSPQPAWENFKGLFNSIDQGNERLGIPGYNGGLFAKDEDINALAISEKMCARFAAMGDYDYDSEVSVNILGHVFEQSISDIEDLKKELDPDSAPPPEVGSKRRTDGIFYTPPFITRHIVEQTVGRWLAERKAELGFDKLAPLADADYASIRIPTRGRKVSKVVFNENIRKHVAIWEAYRDRLSTIRVVDPACGSGAFLNEVFDLLYREGQTINRTLETLYGGQINLFRWDTHILANNVYGVDINSESVEITKLSLWLKTANRNEKLSYLDDNIKTGNSLIDDASVVGDNAFDWEVEFEEIMEDGGFDVVVGNPPYVDSEAMVKAWTREREFITQTYSQTRGNWDLYIAFLELGCDLMAPGGYLSYITPDKWISKDFGTAMRKRIVPGILSILPVGRDVFESALVDSIITTIGDKPSDELQIHDLIDGEIVVSGRIPKAELNGEDGFDRLLSVHHAFLRKLDKKAAKRLGELAETENACATADTYTLGGIIEDAESVHGYDPAKDYRIANTGTLDKYVFRWGAKPMRYLKNDYEFPIVSKASFRETLGATYNRRAASPKIVIKGLTLLDGAIDLDGSYVPGKTTLVICSDDLVLLKCLAGIVNSQIASFYVKQKYASASYNGGVNFTSDMINSIPVPKGIKKPVIAALVDRIVAGRSKFVETTASLHSLLRASGGAAKLGRKLDAWHELSSAEFLAEIVKRGVHVPIKERPQWLDVFARHKARVAKVMASADAAEAEIDETLATAFGLSQTERDIIGI
ncbi:type II endonuclease-methyltransferasefusion protein [Devosia pacifica]|uniref:site-specific DNA-methyltransferase (adenine-specific) n=1 Tax=Devosia pacifica TaxID=1335967 RepID=A0A918RXL8_9HYPH|nr:DNA methyltransferase [Devosia pacifica]GHA13177.1 type II endonuclease-methyltransferasefusion protein [Devosia pacifica]